MTRPRNPCPGVTRSLDRRGRVRWRFRAGVVDCYLPGDYGSAAFTAADEAARQGKRPDGKATHRSDPHGMFGWVIERYKASGIMQTWAPIARRDLTLELERFCVDHGHRLVAEMRWPHVEKMMHRKAATPAAANKLLKLIRRLVRFSIRLELIQRHVTMGIKLRSVGLDGYHTWIDSELKRFRRCHDTGPEARLAFELLLSTGASRQDAVHLGWQNVKGGRIEFKRGKTAQALDLPILPELAAELAHLTHGKGRAYGAEGFGNWFRDQCDAAALKACSAHGLRKAGATRLAHAGCTETETMAFLGHRTPNEARSYAKAADRGRLADTAFHKLRVADTAEDVSNLRNRLDKAGFKPTNHKGN